MTSRAKVLATERTVFSSIAGIGRTANEADGIAIRVVDIEVFGAPRRGRKRLDDRDAVGDAEDAYQIYVRQYPDSGRKWRVSDQGGMVAAWTPDGRRLLYESLDHRVMAVDFKVVDGEFQPDPPKRWVDAQLADTGMGPGFEVAPDGRLVALMAPAGSPASPGASNVTLVLNFFSEVKRRTTQ